MTDLAPKDTTDFDDADRGFLGPLKPALVTGEDGRAVWDADAYAFLTGPCPDTADPRLWRQGQLVAKQGLYEVAEGIYQVRNLDVSNMTLVEGDRGVIVIDPLLSAETAAAGLRLYRAHRGKRPVSGLVYSHAHGGHYGGARGVLPHGHEPVPILAPAGFMERAAAENVYAGGAMTRRARYMYGTQLPKGPAGQIGCGPGTTSSTGTVTLIPPTVDVTRTGQQETVDGIRIVFQLTPGAEAPAEMNLFLPERRALCMAESATHTMNAVLPLSGAVVRDSRLWAHHIDESLALFGHDTDVVLASHHWPTWGRERIAALLTGRRDLYAYLHDQTLRLLNRGLTGAEIAEQIQLPPGLRKVWAARGHQGSLQHNVKAIHQRYLGWFDGNPAHLWEHPPVEQAKRYTDAMGGVAETVAKGKEYAAAGDLRFAATLLNHAVFADPDNAAAREELAAVYDRLGQSSESGTWRNVYLTGALELRGEAAEAAADTGDGELAMALSVDRIIDSLAVRINGPEAWHTALTMAWHLTDERRVWRLTLSNGALTYRSAPDAKGPGRRGGRPGPPPDLTLTLTKPQLLGVLAGDSLEGVGQQGDPKALDRLVALLDTPDPNFAIIEP
ncbi:alkyl/aryl-sulfatase [Streptomyces sp. H27-D2]|uniref:alkyl/aryl-sulfatase n=1 Tax=Streptomyces sp. H27-D2 TaxID=3046304 RepID=UPI002DBF17D7|nr:alkyl sulfatase dimerization domain-containing protein [Streptomyces sp. H27-D2]MEC4020270.1 alkyl sulfatase dimerization domain-containing protein [Streptomyces sp. H27-D2]